MSGRRAKKLRKAFVGMIYTADYEKRPAKNEYHNLNKKAKKRWMRRNDG